MRFHEGDRHEYMFIISHKHLLRESILPSVTPDLLKSAPVLSGACFSSGLKSFTLQDQLNFFGVQRFVHEKSICQILVLLRVGFQEGFGTLV